MLIKVILGLPVLISEARHWKGGLEWRLLLGVGGTDGQCTVGQWDR